MEDIVFHLALADIGGVFPRCYTRLNSRNKHKAQEIEEIRFHPRIGERVATDLRAASF